MKKQIRNSVFETNSSSTHSMCIAICDRVDLPEHLYFELGEFGWEFDTLSSISEKASYLYTALVINDMFDGIEHIKNILKLKGVETDFEEITYNEYTSNDGSIYKYVSNGCYIDHGSDTIDFVNAILESPDRLLNFLFSPLSFILTGNDNSDISVDIKVDYPHEEYYKDN